MTEITIDKRLNLVIPVEDGGSALYVHSTPIPRAVFKRYSKIIARTFNEIYGGGYGVIAGPRIAADLLESAARASNEWDGPTGVERGLLGEVYRLTNVAVPGASGGWDVVPYQIAVSTGQISEDDADEVNNALVFFYCGLVDAQKDGLAGNHPRQFETLGRAFYVLERYGIRGFLEDVDRAREFWREGDHVVSALLDWAAGSGFEQIMAQGGVKSWSSSHEFRNRFSLSRNMIG